MRYIPSQINYLLTISAILLISYTPTHAQQLLVENSNNTEVFDGGTYSQIYIRGAHNKTFRNITVNRTTSGHAVDIRDSSNLVFENLTIDGNFEACSGFTVLGTNGLTVQRSTIRNIADDGIQFSGGSDFVFDQNVIHTLISKGTDGRLDGPCFNGHSDAIEMSRLKTATITRNVILTSWELLPFFYEHGFQLSRIQYQC